MADIGSTIQHYQSNFQRLPGIDTTKSGDFRNASHHLIDDFIKNNMETQFEQQIDTYLDSDRLQYVNKTKMLHLLKSIFIEIHVFTNIHLENSIFEGIDWMNQMFGNTYPNWGLLTENLYNTHSTFKSPEWIASFAWGKLKSLTNKNNFNRLPFCVSDVGGGMNNNSSIKDMYENHGIQHFVMFDDGAYSGLQKSLAVFSHTWTELTSNPNVKKPFSIIVIIPFITNKALDAFRTKAITYNLGINRELINRDHNYCEWEDTINKRSVFLWGGKVVMPTTTEIVHKVVSAMIQPTQKTYGICNDLYNFIIKDILTDAGGTLGASMCLFEHKLPDFVSLPIVVADIFINNAKMRDHYYNHNPPYKHISNRDRQDFSKVFECYKMVYGGRCKRRAAISATAAKKLKEKITYCKQKYTVLLSKRGNKYIIHNDRKVYLKSLKL